MLRKQLDKRLNERSASSTIIRHSYRKPSEFDAIVLDNQVLSRWCKVFVNLKIDDLS